MRVGILNSVETTGALSSTLRLEEAILGLGHESVRLLEGHLRFEEQKGTVAVFNDGVALGEIDVIIVRANFIEEPSQHQAVYDLLKTAGYKLVNGGEGILRTKNKLLQRAVLHVANISIPHWSIAFGYKACVEAANVIGYPVMLKVAFGAKGTGVFYVENKETLFPIADYLAVRDGNPVLVEEFINEANRSTVRAFVVGEDVVAAIRFDAASGEVRSNGSPDGTEQQAELTDEERKLALQATQAMKLDIAGVDILRSNRGPLIMEVNANPGFKELERVTGLDVAKKIVEFAIHRVS